MLTLLVLSFKDKCEEKEGKNTRFPVLLGDIESELRFQGIPRFRHSPSDLGYPNIFCFSLLWKE